MNERLASLLKKYDELTLLIQDPSLVKDQNRYRNVMKEHSHLSEIAELHNSVEGLEKQINDTKPLFRKKKIRK